MDLTEENNREVTFSNGVITFHGNSYSMDEMIRKTDDLIYSEKNYGKNNIKFAVEPLD